ncbi:hypothetical protein [Ruminococcus sp. HUN007]|uniref:hypothetical protein n=1 Tax=Ruminococcus sp. HUN007 TaxID=1514668 RepID=UPI0005D2D03F|nr:hypothetical protein [Ruminococcus sp. HUN007]
MNPKLIRDKFRSRTPLCIRIRDGILYLNTQIEIARSDGLRAGTYCEFTRLNLPLTPSEIGLAAKNLISTFNSLSDLTEEQFISLKGIKVEEYNAISDDIYLKSTNAKSFDELNEYYEECVVFYNIDSDIYEFNISSICEQGKRKIKKLYKSTGTEDILTFETPLIFKDSITSEALGTMILEAFDRSHKMSLKLSGKYIPPKTIEIYNNISVEFTPPNDKHFTDLDDGGIGEIYQLYSYVPKEGAKATDAIALTSAPELFKELTVQNIREEWIRTYGEPDEICVTEKQYGIFKFRAEIKNKDYYCISYITTIDCGEFTQNLECGMQIISPARKKKLCASLAESIEQFALSCKIKYQS